jgi:LacI family transcriptional regulator
MKRTTIKDIARRLGVNPSTVSRGLKDHPDIGVALRMEIKRLAEELHYRPNQMAVQLRQRSSRLIGLIIPEVTMFFYPSVIKGMQQVLQDHGYSLMMLPSNESPERELENIRICAENEVAGILISMTRQTKTADHLVMLHDIGIPVVMFDKVEEKLPYDSVVLEDEAAAALAVQHLVESGCSRIGGIFGNPGMLITQRRVQGFRQSLKTLGLPFSEHAVFFADNAQEAKNCALALMALDSTPDGLFAMTDEIVIGAMSGLAQSGKRIPADCSVICISDGFLPYALYPPVTFLHHNGEEVGALAANRMVSLIESGEFINDDYLGEKYWVTAKLMALATTHPLKNV